MLDVTSISCHVRLQMSAVSTFKSALFSQGEQQQQQQKTGEEMKAIVVLTRWQNNIWLLRLVTANKERLWAPVKIIKLINKQIEERWCKNVILDVLE